MISHAKNGHKREREILLLIFKNTQENDRKQQEI